MGATMDQVLAIIPARSGSKGIPNKNFTHLCGMTPYERAIHAAVDAGVPTVVTTTDWVSDPRIWVRPIDTPMMARWIQRPAELAQDDTPMIAVVQHVLGQIPGPPDQKIVLLQPTQPLREPKHITQALELLTPDVDSVVSVIELPQAYASVNHAYIFDGSRNLSHQWTTFAPSRRQDCGHSYVRDGTCYAFHRRTVEQHGTIYGDRVKPLIIPASETQALDTPADWAEAERRLRERA